ncbi:hypothetical protein CL614_03360 [archaeon]|nr:hypothetical protein [archaeon]|tara:strand:- start:651 stop:1073 length:423 start_codon:yes stop_codon:yes gene_type:complete
MSEQRANFHRSRRMFYLLGSALVVAQDNVPWSHTEWIKRDTPDQAADIIANHTRGYVSKNDDVYFYRGMDFRVDEETEREFFDSFEDLADVFQLDQEAMVYGGVIPQAKRGQWLAQKEYGTIGECLQDVERGITPEGREL